MCASVAAFVRARGWRGVVLATCHDDVEAPLAPDWTFDTAGCCVRAYKAAADAAVAAEGKPTDVAPLSARAPAAAAEGEVDDGAAAAAAAADAAADARALAAAWSFARVELRLTLCEVEGASVWPRFEPHHYLSGELNPAARCFVARVAPDAEGGGAVVGFVARMSQMGSTSWREHRTVVLPQARCVVARSFVVSRVRDERF